MPPAAIPLSDLARRLARKESEVQKLRRAYETRLADLKNRREQLAEKLRRLETEIQAAAQESPKPAAGPVTAEEAAPSKVSGRHGKLPALIVKLIQEAGQALTVKQLANEVRRRRFPTKSKNVARLIQTRVSEMVKKGVLAHASGQPGYVVKYSANGQTGSSQEGTRAKRSSARKSKVAMAAGRVNGRGSQPPLREVLTQILEQHKEPIGGGDLAQKALATGYKSKSKKFREVVWVTLGKMKNVERVPGKGYRLKRR